MSDRLTSLLGIRYPVIMGAVAQTPDLGVAVSNAGGLGCIAGAVMPPDVLRERIHRFREMSDKPFSVNFPIVLTRAEDIEPKMRMMVEERVPVVMTSAGNPKLWSKFLRDGGCRVAHVLATVYHASKAAEAGVDVIIAEPAESGGYRGEHEVSMMILIPAIRRAFPEIPLVAAGAVADGAGLAAVMALGSDGVQLGTRFMATKESDSPDTFRKLVLAANDTATMSAEGRVKPRVSRPEFTESVIGERRQVQMGQVSALINEIKSVEEVMRDLVDGGGEIARGVAAGLAEIAQS